MATASRSTPGIVERHARSCPARTATARRDGVRCKCSPTFEAFVWSPRDQRKIRRVFPTQAAARSWRRDALASVANGKLRASRSTSVAEEARAWIERLDRGDVATRSGRPYKPSVVRLYRRDLERFVIGEDDGPIPALIGSIRLSQLRRRDVQELLVDPLARSKENGGLGLSGSRVRDVLNALRAVLRDALMNDELAVNPVDEHLKLPADSEPRERAASPDEAAALLEALPECDRALWATAFYGGLRRGELRALRCSDFAAGMTEIHVQRGWDDVEGEIEPKSKKGNRRVPIAGALRLILLEHLTRTGRRGDDLVFGRTASAPFTPTHLRERAHGAWAAAAIGSFLRRESPAVELVPIGLHECRHTFVSLMVAAGRSLEEVGDYVGHSSAYMTDRYRHLLDGARVEAAAALDALIATGARTGAQSR